MVQELERKRQSASFPESAPAANPVFFRTYSRRTEAGLKESWDEVCDSETLGRNRTLRCLVELEIVILASDTEHQELKRDHSALQQEHYEIKDNYSQLEQKYSELKEDYQELKDQKDREIQWLNDRIEIYESEADPYSSDGDARCNRREYDDY
jgi:hypothetical protein